MGLQIKINHLLLVILRPRITVMENTCQSIPEIKRPKMWQLKINQVDHMHNHKVLCPRILRSRIMVRFKHQSRVARIVTPKITLKRPIQTINLLEFMLVKTKAPNSMAPENRNLRLKQLKSIRIIMVPKNRIHLWAIKIKSRRIIMRKVTRLKDRQAKISMESKISMRIKISMVIKNRMAISKAISRSIKINFTKTQTKVILI